jgi:glycosyltransferase involved in cell wall biosynthesis
VNNKLTSNENKATQANLRICHVITSLGAIGGAERMLLRLLLADPDTTNQKMVLVLRHAGAWGKQLELAGVTVHELGMDSILDLPRAYNQLKKLIISFKPDIVQTWMFHADLLGGLAARLNGYSNIIWGIRVTEVPRDNLLTILIMKVCAYLSRLIPKKIVCVAEAARITHIKYGYDAARMAVIHNGFDFSEFIVTQEQKTAVRQECKLLDEDLVVGYVGRFHPDKGQDNFVKAASIVLCTHPKVKFLLVGRECDTKNAALMRWLIDGGMQDSFILLGERKDIPACLAAMDVFCLPSRNEGFPNALGEAMLMGLPCVSTLVGDADVLVGDTGILVPSQDAQALAEGLLKIIALPESQRKQMGQHAKDRVMSEFSIKKTLARFEALYQQMVTNKT